MQTYKDDIRLKVPLELVPVPGKVAYEEELAMKGVQEVGWLPHAVYRAIIAAQSPGWLFPVADPLGEQDPVELCRRVRCPANKGEVGGRGGYGVGGG